MEYPGKDSGDSVQVAADAGHLRDNALSFGHFLDFQPHLHFGLRDVHGQIGFLHRAAEEFLSKVRLDVVRSFYRANFHTPSLILLLVGIRGIDILIGGSRKSFTERKKTAVGERKKG